jgi:hypothetical protein
MPHASPIRAEIVLGDGQVAVARKGRSHDGESSIDEPESWRIPCRIIAQ